MDDFLRLIGKLAIAMGIGVAVLLLLFVGILVLVPEKLFRCLYYGVILLCVGVLVYLIFCLSRIGLTYLRMRREHGSTSGEREDKE